MSQTEGEDAGSETTEAGSSSTESTFTSESILSAEQSTNENGTVNTSASVQEAPKLSFSEDTLMEWPREPDFRLLSLIWEADLQMPQFWKQTEESAPHIRQVPVSW